MAPRLKNVPRGVSETGFTGLKTSGGLVREEFLADFVGKRKYKILTEMTDNEPLISGTYFAIRQLIKRAKWTVQPFEKTESDKSVAQFVESNLHDMSASWEDTLDEILSFIVFGFSTHEIVYKIREDGRIGWRKLPIRAQETISDWYFDYHGGITGLRQQTDQANQPPVNIPIQKLLLFRTTSYKNNPEGRSIFRASYVPYYYKKRIQNLEAMGIERELNGLPVARIPIRFMQSNASSEEQTVFSDYQELVKNIRADDQAGVVLPSDTWKDKDKYMYDFELMSTKGRRAIDTEIVLSRLNREILITVMADFLLLGHESVGSYALSSDKTHLFATAVGGFMGQIATVFNKHAIPRLLELNNMDVKRPPKLIHGDIETESAKDIFSAIKSLSEAGVEIKDSAILNEAFRRAGFESIEDTGEDQFKITPLKDMQPQPQGGTSGQRSKQ